MVYALSSHPPTYNNKVLLLVITPGVVFPPIQKGTSKHRKIVFKNYQLTTDRHNQQIYRFLFSALANSIALVTTSHYAVIKKGSAFQTIFSPVPYKFLDERLQVSTYCCFFLQCTHQKKTFNCFVRYSQICYFIFESLHTSAPFSLLLHISS